MRILIDLQACQSTGSRHRGIGRYSLALARAMVKNAGSHDLQLMLSGLFPETIQPLRHEFEGLVPSDRIHIWQTPGPVAELFSDNYWRCRTAELVREQALASLRPDFVHVTSLFEGSGDNAVSSVGVNGEHLPTAVTLYDLIPLVYEKQYLGDPRQRAWYYRKLGSLKRADLLLAISESSRREGLDWLDLPPERIVNISSAVDAHFQPRSCTDDVMLSLRRRFALVRPFVMYTGGIDLRKNIEGLVRAYAALPLPVRQHYQLAIVCSVQPGDRNRLEQIARQYGLAHDELVLTGFVSEQDLLLLYQDCALFIFPSWHEGFGLPALEAMSCGAPVIAANTSSLPEVIGRADALFDPRNEVAITTKLHQVLTDGAFRSGLCLHGLEQAKKFSWDASAKTAIAAFEEQYARHKSTIQVGVLTQFQTPKPKLAFFSPLPSARSGIAYYCAELLPELASFYDIELIVDQAAVDDAWLTANFSVRTWQWFDQNAERFDRVLYHFGNSTFHTYMFEMLDRHPGVVVLHDFFVSNLIHYLDATGQKPGEWSKKLYQSHGYTALLDRQKTSETDGIIWKYPCNLSILSKAEGIIVHSQYSIELVKQWYGDKLAETCEKIPHLRKSPFNTDKSIARQQLGLADGDFLLCSFGMLGPVKENIKLLNAWLASPLSNDKHCYLVFVGQPDDGEYCTQLIRSIKNKGSGDRIRITGFADTELFRTYLMAADAAVQLRSLSRGETSGTVLDCMAYAIPTIVNHNGSMRELPEYALIKLADEFTEIELLDKLVLLRNDTALRSKLGQSAAKFIREHHAPEFIAQQYSVAIEKYFNGEPASRLHRTLKKIAAIEIDTSPKEQDLISVAQCLSINEEYRGVRQIFVDISKVNSDADCDDYLATKKLVSAVLLAFFNTSPIGFRVEPVTTSVNHGKDSLRYARHKSCAFLDLTPILLPDDLIEVRGEDIIVTLIETFASNVGSDLLFLSLGNGRYQLNIGGMVNDLGSNKSEKFLQELNLFWTEFGSK